MKKNTKYARPEIAKVGRAIRITGSTRGGNRYDCKCWLKWVKPLGDADTE